MNYKFIIMKITSKMYNQKATPIYTINYNRFCLYDVNKVSP